MKVLQEIIAHIFGRKYWANIINTRGTDRCELSCFIFTDKEQAEQHKQSVDATRSFMFIETVSFRSHKEYRCVRSVNDSING